MIDIYKIINKITKKVVKLGYSYVDLKNPLFLEKYYNDHEIICGCRGYDKNYDTRLSIVKKSRCFCKSMKKSNHHQNCIFSK